MQTLLLEQLSYGETTLLEMEDIGGIVEFDTGSVETYMHDTIYESLTMAVSQFERGFYIISILLLSCRIMYGNCSTKHLSP